MNYHNISYPDQNNGDGLRVVLWLSGCSHKCCGCQNPQTWNPNSGIPFDESSKKELFRELNKDYISGLTLTGGDPLYETNLDDVLNLVNEFRLSFGNSKTIWIYSGFYWKEIFEPYFTDHSERWINNDLQQNEKRKQIVSKCDVFVDGRYVDSQRDLSLCWRGSSNQSIIDVSRSLQENGVVLYCE